MPKGTYIRTGEHRRKMSIIQQKVSRNGVKQSEATKKKKSILRFKRKAELGYINSPETREKMRLSHIGKKISITTKHKMSLAKKGKKRSLDTRRRISEANRGSRNYFWKGGIAYLPYSVDWTETLRRSIREKDRYVCQICNKQQGDRAFCVHHIDYNKKNNNPYNLITLCFSCHLKTNFSRENWIKYFNNKYKRLTIVKSGNNADTS